MQNQVVMTLLIGIFHAKVKVLFFGEWKIKGKQNHVGENILVSSKKISSGLQFVV